MTASLLAIFVSIVLLALPCEVLAQDDAKIVGSDDIVKALSEQEKPKTRGITRGFRVEEVKKVDLQIPFEYNSSILAPEAVYQLKQLSDALSQNEFGENRFEIGGHTDASGASEYNRSLSERRANAVRQFLIDQGISPNRLDSVGHGEDKLLHPDDPSHPSNRRVEVLKLDNS